MHCVRFGCILCPPTVDREGSRVSTRVTNLQQLGLTLLVILGLLGLYGDSVASRVKQACTAFQ